MRELLSQNLFALLLLRPLITGGIVFPVVMRTQHCIHEVEFAETMTEIVHDFAEFTAKDQLKKFKLTYERPDKSASGQPQIYLEGPEGYIEHGFLIRTLDEPPGWLPRTTRFDKDGRTEIRGAHKRQLVTQIFDHIADNVSFYLAYGTRRNARFLSDMAGETDFLEWLTKDERLAAKSLALRELEHAVPVLADLSVATILRIRKEERDSFEAYRMAVKKISAEIMSAGNRVSKKEAREMFRAAVEPELRRMDREVAAYRKSQGKRVLGGMASILAGVAIGAYAGLPTLVSAPLVATASVVGGRLLSKAAESACEHGPESRQRNDLYFLLRLTQEAET